MKLQNLKVKLTSIGHRSDGEGGRHKGDAIPDEPEGGSFVDVARHEADEDDVSSAEDPVGSTVAAELRQQRRIVVESVVDEQ